MKYRLHDYILASFIEKHAFTSEAKAKAHAVLCDFSSVRKFLNGYPEGAVVEISWQAAFPGSLAKLCEFTEGLVFGDLHDSSLKTARKYRRSVEEVLDYSLMKEDLDGIVELVQKESLNSKTDPSSGGVVGCTEASAVAGGSADSA
eukprot:5197805-Alexandrium_andersonii.AAC.1